MFASGCLKVLLVLSMMGLLAPATVTDPLDWPGLDDLPYCVENSFQGCLWGCAYQNLPATGCVPCGVGCTDWTCACNDYGPAFSVLSSVASYQCSTNPTAVAEATSILNAFCLQLTATTSEPSGPTLPANTGMDPTDTGASSPTPNSDTGGCVFIGGNQSNIDCNNNTSVVHSIAGNGRINYTVLICCIAIAAGLIMSGVM